MIITEFSKQPRGPYLFETWLWKNEVCTIIGNLPLELYTSVEQQPYDSMIVLAAELAAYTSSHSGIILDLIYEHYCHFKKRGWLSFWNVPENMRRSEIMSQVESIILSVDSDLSASILVNILWDQEHRLTLTYESGTITGANHGEFEVKNGALITH